MQLNRATKAILTVVLMVLAAGLGASARFYSEALVGAFFGIALLSVLVIHFRICPSWLDAPLVLFGTLVLAGVDFRVLHFKPALMAWPSFAGLVSLLILGVRAMWAEGANRKLMLLGFLPSLLFVASEYFADDLLQLSSQIHPQVFDLYLFSFDSSLRIQIAFLIGQAFSLYPNLRAASLIFYVGLPIPIALVYAGRVLRVREKAIPAFVGFLVTGPIGVLFYNLLPALGPVHLFLSRFPWHALTVEQAKRLFLEPLQISGPPNAIPSLHMAWVLLAWWYSRGLSWWERGVAMAFVVFTVLATMGTGEHYFVDLVVAFPFALFIEGLCALQLPLRNGLRLAAVAAGLFLTFAWMASLRFAPHFFWRSPLIPWILCAGTLAVSAIAEEKLAKAVQAAEGELPSDAVALRYQKQSE